MRWFYALAAAAALSLSCVAPVRADDAAARAELIGLWSKMMETKDLAYRADMTTTDKKGRSYETKMEVRWPNQFRIQSQGSDMIILPQGTWMNAGGNWMKMPMDMSKMIQQFTPEATKASMDGLTAVRSLGSAEVNGKDCLQFSYDFDAKVAGIRSSGTATIAVDRETGYPVRIETNGEAMGQKSKTVTNYEYDSSIRISAPN
ncbi:MAG: hypothetical protein IPK97_12345 [Ahniella sp.]|nr:hypothetical protein [Ahniella sp.]